MWLHTGKPPLSVQIPSIWPNEGLSCLRCHTNQPEWLEASLFKCVWLAQDTSANSEHRGNQKCVCKDVKSGGRWCWSQQDEQRGQPQSPASSGSQGTSTLNRGTKGGIQGQACPRPASNISAEIYSLTLYQVR